MSRRLTLALLLACFAWRDLLAEETAFRFVIDADALRIAPNLILVSHELRNDGATPQYIAQFPGASLVAMCEQPPTTGDGVPQGVEVKVPGGVWCSGATLPRKYFLRIEPGEALLGKSVVEFPSDCTAGIRIAGVYQSESGEAWSLPLRLSRIYAKDIVVTLTGAPPGANSSE